MHVGILFVCWFICKRNITLFTSTTFFCGTDIIMPTHSPRSIWIWGLFYRISSTPKSNGMDLNNVMEGGEGKSPLYNYNGIVLIIKDVPTVHLKWSFTCCPWLKVSMLIPVITLDLVTSIWVVCVLVWRNKHTSKRDFFKR